MGRGRVRLSEEVELMLMTIGLLRVMGENTEDLEETVRQRMNRGSTSIR